MPRGWKRFIAGRLSAADVNDYLMNQVVGQFASVEARDASITAPVNGQEAWIDNARRKSRFVDGSWRWLNDEFAGSAGSGVWDGAPGGVGDASEVILVSQTIPDQGHPYVAELQAQLIAAAVTGVEFHARIRLNGVNGLILSPDAVRSGQFPNMEGTTLTIARCDTPVLTGAATIVVTGRKTNGGAGNWYVAAGGNLLSIGLRPAVL